MNCQINNPNASDLFIMDAWLEVRMTNGPRLCEGRFFHTRYAMAFPAIVRGKNAAFSDGEILIPLSPVAMETIEDARKSGDLGLEISSRVIACSVFQAQGAGLVLHTPMETQFCSAGYSSSIRVTIPQSEWIQLLQRMQWTQLALMESPTAVLRSDPRLAGARERLHEAETRFWGGGDWEGAIESCRKAWEAAVRTLTAAETNPEAMKKLGEQLTKHPKTVALDNLARSLGTFVHQARHDQPVGMNFTRGDATLTINLTAALLAYLAQLS